MYDFVYFIIIIIIIYIIRLDYLDTVYIHQIQLIFEFLDNNLYNLAS